MNGQGVAEVAAAQRPGKLIVVVSAMAGETNRLALAHKWRAGQA
jgi:aspartokinase